MYTVTIQKILQSYLINKHGYTEKQAFLANYKDTISITTNDLFDFSYPLFDDSYKLVLQEKILKRYYMREIAHETVGMFKLALDERLNSIMGYYNQLYLSAQLEIKPLLTMNYQENFDRTNKVEVSTNASTTSTSSGKTGTVNKLWEQPQSGDAVNDNYLTEQNQGDTDVSSSGEGSTQQSSNSSDVDTYLKTITGFSNISQSDLLLKYRQTLLNIDEMIVKDLADLFFMLMD